MVSEVDFPLGWIKIIKIGFYIANNSIEGKFEKWSHIPQQKMSYFVPWTGTKQFNPFDIAFIFTVPVPLYYERINIGNWVSSHKVVNPNQDLSWKYRRPTQSNFSYVPWRRRMTTGIHVNKNKFQIRISNLNVTAYTIVTLQAMQFLEDSPYLVNNYLL